MRAARFYRNRAGQWLARMEAQRRVLRRSPDSSIDSSVRIVSPDLLELGARADLQTGVVLHCGGLEWSGGRGHVRIGADAVLSPYCVVFGAGGIEIGDRFDCGPGCMLFSSRTLYGHTSAEPPGRSHTLGAIAIGDDVTLYAGCVIGPGVTIGSGAAVGAGSVVLGDVPPRALYAGAPARRIRDIPPSGSPGTDR